jgi:hypothetical protein
VTDRAAALAAMALLLGGCAFSRHSVNEGWTGLDPAGLEVGRSTFEDVLDRLGPPAPASEEALVREVPDLRAFRYPVTTAKTTRFTPAYWISLPCAWVDEQSPSEVLVEFDGKGVVSRITVRTEDAIWRPLQSESSRTPPTTRFPGAPR